MKVVLLIAGMGQRLSKKTKNIPKTLLEINNKPILFHIIDRIIDNDIKDFVVVVGYKKEIVINALKKKYPDLKFQFVVNEIYDKTNTMYSMFLTKNYINNGMIYAHGDVIINKNILKDLLDPKNKNAAIVEPSKESMQAFGSRGKITKISKKKDAIGKALGIYKFSQETVSEIYKEAEKVIKTGAINVFQSEAINPVIRNHRLDLISTNGRSWIEVDDENDLIEAERIIKKIEQEEVKRDYGDL